MDKIKEIWQILAMIVWLFDRNNNGIPDFLEFPENEDPADSD